MITWYSCILLNNGIAVIFALLFVLSEYIGRNPKIKENTVYQLVHHFLLKITENNKKEK